MAQGGAERNRRGVQGKGSYAISLIVIETEHQVGKNGWNSDRSKLNAERNSAS